MCPTQLPIPREFCRQWRAPERPFAATCSRPFADARERLVQRKVGRPGARHRTANLHESRRNPVQEVAEAAGVNCMPLSKILSQRGYSTSTDIRTSSAYASTARLQTPRTGIHDATPQGRHDHLAARHRGMRKVDDYECQPVRSSRHRCGTP